MRHGLHHGPPAVSHHLNHSNHRSIGSHSLATPCTQANLPSAPTHKQHGGLRAVASSARDVVGAPRACAAARHASSTALPRAAACSQLPDQPL